MLGEVLLSVIFGDSFITFFRHTPNSYMDPYTAPQLSGIHSDSCESGDAPLNYQLSGNGQILREITHDLFLRGDLKRQLQANTNVPRAPVLGEGSYNLQVHVAAHEGCMQWCGSNFNF